MGDIFGALGEAVVLLRADSTQLDKDLAAEKKKLEDYVDELSETSGKLGKALSVGVTAPILAIGAAAVGAGLKLDDALDGIRTKTGATGDALKSLEGDFRAVFENVPDDAQVVADTLSEVYARTGQTGEGLQQLTTTVLDLARVTKEDVGTLVPLVTRMFGDWSIATDKQAESLDYVYKVSQQTGIGVSELTQKVVQFGAPLRQLGFTFEQSAALMGKWEKEGVNTDTVLGSLRIGLAKFADAGVDAKKGLADALNEIKALGPGAEATAKAMEVFGKRAGPDMAAAITEGRFEVQQLIKDLQNSNETIGKSVKDTEGFAESFGKFKNKMTDALEPLGTKLLDVADKAVPLLSALATGVGYVVESFSELPDVAQDVILVLVGLAAAAGPAIYGASKLIGAYKDIAAVWNLVSGTGSTLVTLLPKLGTAAALMGQAVLVAGVAWASWKLGEKIGEVTGLTDWVGKKLAGALYGVSESEYEASRAGAKLAEEQKGQTDAAKAAEDIAKKLAAATAQTTQETQAGTKAHKTYTEQLEAARKEVASLTSEQKRQIDAALKLGESSEDIAKKFKVSTAAIELYKDANKESAEEVKKHEEAIKKLNEQLSDKSATDAARDMVAAASKIPDLTRLTLAQVKSINETIVEGIDAYRRRGEQAPRAWTLEAAAAYAAARAIEAANKATEDAGERTAFNPFGSQTVLKPAAGIDLKNIPVSEKFIPLEDLIKTDPKRFATIIGRNLSAAVPLIKLDDKGKPTGPTLMEKLFSGIGGADFGAKLGTTIIGALQGGGSVSKSVGGVLGQQLGTNLTGAIGKTLSSTLGKTIGGAIGSAIPVVGTLLGGAVGGLIGKLFGGNKEKKEVTAALNDLVKNAGGLDKLKAAADAAGFSLDKLLTTGKVKDFNNEVDKLNAALATQQKKIEGINTAVAGVNQLGQGLAARLGKIYDDALKAAQATNSEITETVVQGTEDQQAAWERLATFTYATFAAQVRQTGDVIGALNALGSTFDTLTDLQKKFGFQATDSTTSLLNLYKTVKDNSDVFTSISGVTQVMQGLGDAMLVTGQLGTAFAQELAADFKVLQERGVDSATALALMQQPLQKLWQLQKEGKVTLDETTQAMLDQAEQQGIVGERMKDVNEKILDVLLAISEALGATIPDSVRKFGDAVGNIKVPPIEVPYRYKNEGGGPPFDDSAEPGGFTGGLPELDTGGFANWGAGSLAVLHGMEAVIPLDRLDDMMSSASSAGPMNAQQLTDALKAAGIGRQSLTIAPTYQGTLANEARAYTRDELLPMIISVLKDSGELRAEFFSLQG